MHKALHPRDDKNRLYVSRKEGGKGLANIEKPQSNNSKTTQERANTDYLWQPITAASTYKQKTNQKKTQRKLVNKDGKKNNYMDTSNVKLERLHMKRIRHG